MFADYVCTRWILTSTILLPLLTFLTLLTHTILHLRPRGITNRTALFLAPIGMLNLIVSGAQHFGLESRTRGGRTVCWVSEDVYEDVKGKKEVRRGLGVGAGVVGGLGAVWYVTSYFSSFLCGVLMRWW